MLRTLPRRLASPPIVSPTIRTASGRFRYASTKPIDKPALAQAIKNPAPSLLARLLLPRYPRVLWTARVVIAFLGFALSFHICTQYFLTARESYGISMLPTINSTGDWLLVSKRYRRGRGIEVGDLVSFKHPLREDTRSVKRVIGMAGDFVLRDSPDTSGVMIQVPEGHCYVVGDNLKFSRDSRMFGPLPLALIKGRVIGRFSLSRLWPEFFERGLGPAETDEEP